MKTYFGFVLVIFSMNVFGQISGQHPISSSTPLNRHFVSKAQVDAVKNRNFNQRINQGILLDYDAVDQIAANDSGGNYQSYIWALNSHFPNIPAVFALSWAVVRFDTLFDANTGLSYPRSSTSVKIDSIETFITHQHLVGVRDTVLISVYAWSGAAGITVDANENITNTVLWDTMIITTTSLSPGASMLASLMVYPNITLTYPNNRYSVGVHFYGDTTNTFTILAGYKDLCGASCQAYPSVFNLNSLWRMIAWSNGIDLTGINALAYDCNSNGVVGEPLECEEFPIENLAISSFVTINPTLTATISQGVSKCPPATVPLSVSAVGGTPPYTYTWAPTTGLTSPFAASTNSNVTATTTYTVTVRDNVGAQVVKTVTVTVNGITINAGNDRTISCGQTVSLTATPGGVVTGATFAWSNGVNTLNNPNVGAGTYTITASNSYGCTASDAVSVTLPNVNQTLNFSTNLTNNIGCTNTVVQFTNTSHHLTGWNWSWNFGNGVTSVATNPTYTYTNANTYVVSMSADSAGCSIPAVTKTITMNNCSSGCTPISPTGVPGLTPQWACLPCVVRNTSYAEVIQIENFSTVGGIVVQQVRLDSITNLPTGLSYTVNPANAIITSGGTGCVDITGSTSAPTGNYLLGLYVTVTIQGIGPVQGEITQIIDQLIQLGIIDTTVTPAPDFSYYIRVIQTAGTCNMTGCNTCVTPSAAFNNIASSLNVSFSDQSLNTPTSWSWTFGDGATSTQQNPSHTYSSSGSYSVCLTATNACGNDVICHSVSVTCLPPGASFGFTGSGTFVSFTDNSSNAPTSWSWTFGDGATSTLQSPTHTYATSGSYNVCLSVVNACGNNQSCQTVSVTCVAPGASYNYNAAGTSVSFTDNSSNGPTSWAWTFGDGSTSSLQNPSHTYSTGGSYNVCLTATNSCGNNTSCQTVSVTCVAPAASYSYSASGTSVSFTDNSSNGASAWSWTFGDGSTSTQQNPSHTYSTGGSFNVCLTATNSCGNNTSCQTISVTCVGPSASYSYSASGTNVSFTDNSSNGPSAWSWTFGDGGTSTQQSPSHSYNTAGSYNVCLTATNSCGNNTSCQTISVTCNTGPSSSFSYTLADSSSASFTDNSTNAPSSWSWNFGDGGTSSQQNPSYTYAHSGTYTVCLDVSNSCGSNSSCQTIVFTGIVQIVPHALKIYPNPFTEVTTIEIPEEVKGVYSLRIVDLLGNELRVMPNLVDRTFQLDRKDLANGIYFIEVRADRRYFGKVMLE